MRLPRIERRLVALEHSRPPQPKLVSEDDGRASWELLQDSLAPLMGRREPMPPEWLNQQWTQLSDDAHAMPAEVMENLGRVQVFDA